jgi:hypothetical protein
LALFLIFSGILTICYNLAWPTDRLSSCRQVALQAALAVSVSGSSLSLRKLVSVVSLLRTLPVSFLNMWIHILGVIPLIVLFCLIELPGIPKVTDLFTIDYLAHVGFGAGSLELFSLCGAVLKDCSGFGFAENVVQLMCISLFLISALVYADTAYTTGQAVGLLLVVLGYVLYSVVGERRAKGVTGGEGDTVALLRKPIDDTEQIDISGGGKREL